MIDFEQELRAVATIKVIGVGGAGGNTVNSIIDSGYHGVECIVANTDSQALELSKAATKIQLGVKSTKGLGTGANPEFGKRAAEEDLDKIMEQIEDADIVFLTAGMGGGTGSGAMPVIAKAIKEKGILCIAVVTKPFTFEGKKRGKVAQEALEQLRKTVDTLLVIPNQKLLEFVGTHVSMIDAFAMINDVLGQSVKGISDIITKPGYINVDFADVKTIMQSRGLAIMGTGRAAGAGRAQEAALRAISSPLLENMSIKGARGVLINITGGKDLGLHEISQAAQVIYDQVNGQEDQLGEETNIILGSVIDQTMTDEIAVTVIATGFVDAVTITPTVVAQSELIQPAQSIGQEMPALVTQVVAKLNETVAQPAVEKSPESVQAQPVIQQVVIELPMHIDMSDLDVPAFMRKDNAQ